MSGTVSLNQSKRSRKYVGGLCKAHFLPMFNLFPHNISNVFEAVSSLVLGAGVSAAFYAATATCFFLKDRHGKDSDGSHYWFPLLTTGRLWSGPFYPRVECMHSITALSSSLGYVAELCRRDTNGAQPNLQDSPQDDQTPNTYIHSRRLHCGLKSLQDRRGADGLCHVPALWRRHRVVHMQFAVSCAHLRRTLGSEFLNEVVIEARSVNLW